MDRDRRLLGSLLLAFLLCLAAACRDPVSSGPAVLSGVVGAVPDGDSLLVRIAGEEVEVRLWGVDCPEGGQPFGDEARRFVRDGWLERSVELEVVDLDRYGRTVAIVYGADGTTELNRELVAAGWAWWYRRYAPRREDYRAAEAAARAAGRGLWARPGAQPPWEWRDQQRGREAAP